MSWIWLKITKERVVIQFNTCVTSWVTIPSVFLLSAIRSDVSMLILCFNSLTLSRCREKSQFFHQINVKILDNSAIAAWLTRCNALVDIRSTKVLGYKSRIYLCIAKCSAFIFFALNYTWLLLSFSGIWNLCCSFRMASELLVSVIAKIVRKCPDVYYANSIGITSV